MEEASQWLITSRGVSDVGGAQRSSHAHGPIPDAPRAGNLSVSTDHGHTAQGSVPSRHVPSASVVRRTVRQPPHTAQEVLTTQDSKDALNPSHVYPTGCSLPSSGRISHVESPGPSVAPATSMSLPRECDQAGLAVAGQVAVDGNPSSSSPKFHGIRFYPLGSDREYSASAAFDPTKEYCSHDTLFFWQSPSCFSQWTPSPFTVDGVRYNCSEQFFAATKARLFGDDDTLRKILHASSPVTHKELGRKVRGFDESVWARERENVVVTASYYKFSQNPRFLRHLLDTGDLTLAEASPFDTIWGIGCRADDPAALHPSTWRGSNLLGKSLQVVRTLLRDHASLPSPVRPVSDCDTPSRRTIHEVNPSTNEPVPDSPAPPAAPSDRYSGYSPHAPKDHSAHVLSVTSVEYTNDKSAPLLPEHGPCLVDGIVTVHDDTFTAKVKVHAGPAKAQYGCAALLDSGSPATFIDSNAVATLRALNAISDDYIVDTTTRSWGGFGTSQSLRTSRMIRLSVQFFHGDRPSASLAVWAHIVPSNTMQYPILLGRDSFMRFNTRTYRSLPPHPLDNHVYGEFTLSHHDPSGAVAYVPDHSAPADQFHLRYAGDAGRCLTSDPQYVEVNLVRANGLPALTGDYLVDLLPDVAPEELFVDPDRQLFVSHGRQFLPLSGAAELEPGQLLGTASAPLMRVPVNFLQRLPDADASPRSWYSLTGTPSRMGLGRCSFVAMQAPMAWVLRLSKSSLMAL